MRRRRVAGVALLAAGVLQMLALPGYYTADASSVALALAGLLLAGGYLVLPASGVTGE
jgi:hypothetical protein